MVKFDGCFFSKNNITTGYFIFSSFALLKISNSAFTLNNINSINQNGGIIRTGSNLDVSTSLFSKNFIVNNTSLICSVNDDESQTILVNVNDSMVFSSNTQLIGNILAVNISGKNILIEFNNITFQNNCGPGSLLYAYKTFQNGNFKNLFFSGNFGSQLIYLESIQNVLIENLRFVCNNNLSGNYYQITKDSLTQPGNCLTVVNYEDFQMNDCLFFNNVAISTLTGLLLVQNSKIIIDPSTTKVIINKLNCVKNNVNVIITSIHSGNCIVLVNQGNVTMTNIQISDNWVVGIQNDALTGNPCLFSDSINNNLTIKDSFFTNNQAISQCACFEFHGTLLMISNVSFINNTAIKEKDFFVKNVGGSLNIGAEQTILVNLIIANCSALKGAAFFFHNQYSKSYQTLNATNLLIFNNSGIQTSAMEFDASLRVGDFKFYQCKINNNSVTFYGVITTFYYTDFYITFLMSDISYNFGISAGAAISFCHYGGIWNVNQTTFIGNVLTGDNIFVGGGAFLVFGVIQSTIIYVTDCKFINNTSSGKGGAIQNIYGQLFVYNSIFIGNDGVYGGAVSVSFYCPDTYENVIFSSDSISLQGGCIYLTDQYQGW